MTAYDAQGYPARLEGDSTPPLNRWLWIVKWALGIPHFILLAFLWIAFSFVTFIAFFAILITGRYPRALFDFNVGVMRWTWRVAFWSYNALGTDRYPPFSLGEEPDYPARLEVAYPASLSRGLVLIKWWLLAIPQYIVVAIFTGGAWAQWSGSSGTWWATSAGLIGVLVLISGVVLLFTGRLPQAIFDFVLGMDRWVFRVVVYTSLMTDRYPPFRLDQGSREPPAGAEAASEGDEPQAAPA